MTTFTDGGARLHVAVQADADRLTFTLTGELDGVSGPPFADLLTTVIDDSVGHVAIDVAQIGFLDLSGLRVLLRAWQMCACRDITLTLREPQPHVVWLLQLTEAAAVLLPDGGISADTAAHRLAGYPQCSAITAGEPPVDRPQAPPGNRDFKPRLADTPDERDQRASDREEQADDRELLLQTRDEILDERQQRISEHQRWEDIREDQADTRERHLDRREHEH